MNRDQLRALHLAGTVAVPQRFPELGRILWGNGRAASSDEPPMLGVEHVLNPKLWIRRWFHTSDVKAVFLPQYPQHVDFSEGDWLLGEEICQVLPVLLAGRPSAYGITYVAEQAPTLMQVEVGMTAAESVEYYPPLPDDRTRDHYQLGGPQQATPHPGDPCTAKHPFGGQHDPCTAVHRPGGKQPSRAWDPCTSRLW